MEQKIWDSDPGLSPAQGSEVTGRACRSHAFGVTHWIIISFPQSSIRNGLTSVAIWGTLIRELLRFSAWWAKRPDGSHPRGIFFEICFLICSQICSLHLVFFVLKIQKFSPSKSKKSGLRCVPNALSLGEILTRSQLRKASRSVSFIFPSPVS